MTAFIEAGGRVFCGSASQVESVDLSGGPSATSSLLLAFGTVSLLQQSVSIAIIKSTQTQSLDMVVLRPGVSGVCTVSLPQSALGPLDYAPAKCFVSEGPFLVAQATRRGTDRTELVVVHSLQSSAAFQQSAACYALGASETLAGAMGIVESRQQQKQQQQQQQLLLHIYDSKADKHRWLLHNAESGGAASSLARRPATALGGSVTAAAYSSSNGQLASISADGSIELRTLAGGAAVWLEGAAEHWGHGAVRGQLELQPGFSALSAHLLAVDTRPASSLGPVCEADTGQPPAAAAASSSSSAAAADAAGILLVLASDSGANSSSADTNSTLYLVSLADLSVLYELRGVACCCTGPLLHPLSVQVLLGAAAEGELTFALLTLPSLSGAAWAMGPLPRVPGAGSATQWQALQTGMGAVSVPLLLKKLAKGKGRKRKAPPPPAVAHPDGPNGEPGGPTPGQRDLASALLRQMQLAQGGMLRAQAAVRQAWRRLQGLRAGELDSLCASHTPLFGPGGSAMRSAARDGGRGSPVRVLALRHSGPGAAGGSVSLHAHVVNDGALPLLALRLSAFAIPTADASAGGSGCEVQTRGDLVPVLLPQEACWILATCHFSPSPHAPDLAVCLRYRRGAACPGLDKSRVAFEGAVGDGSVGAAGEEGRVVGVVGGRPSSPRHLRSTRLSARDLPAAAAATSVHRKASLRTAAVLLFDELRALAVTHRLSRSISLSPTAATASIALTPSLRADPDRAAGLLTRQLRSDLALACALRDA